MADGKWRITRLTANNQGDATRIVEEIRVWWDSETDSEVPATIITAQTLALRWPDNHMDMYPWCSILKAEYTPPTKDQE